MGWAGCVAGRGPWLAPPTMQYWRLCCVGGAQRDPSFSPISPANRLCLRATVQPVPAPSISPFLPSGTSRQPYLTEPLEDLCSAESPDRSLLRLSSVGIEITQLSRGLNVHTSFMLLPVLLTNTPCRWDERQAALSFPALSWLWVLSPFPFIPSYLPPSSHGSHFLLLVKARPGLQTSCMASPSLTLLRGRNQAHQVSITQSASHGTQKVDDLQGLQPPEAATTLSPVDEGPGAQASLWVPRHSGSSVLYCSSAIWGVEA